MSERMKNLCFLWNEGEGQEERIVPDHSIIHLLQQPVSHDILLVLFLSHWYSLRVSIRVSSVQKRERKFKWKKDLRLEWSFNHNYFRLYWKILVMEMYIVWRGEDRTKPGDIMQTWLYSVDKEKEKKKVHKRVNHHNNNKEKRRGSRESA